MRLIDADRLFDNLERGVRNASNEVFREIANTPTVKAIPINWIKNYASHKASKDLIDCYWHFWEDDVLKMVADWEVENGEKTV